MKHYCWGLSVATLAIATIAVREVENGAAALAPAIDSVASPTGPGSAEPNLTTGPDGRIYMSWLEPADSGHALRFSVYDGSTWAPARTIVARRDFFVNWADFPSLAVLENGRLAAHWLQRNGAGTYAYGVRIAQSADGGKTWSAAVIPHRDSTESEHGFVALWSESAQLGAAWLDGRKMKKDAPHGTNEMMLVSTTLRRTARAAPRCGSTSGRATAVRTPRR